MPGTVVQDVDVTLLKAGVPTGPNKASAVLWQGTLNSYTWSGADLNGFAPADLNNANFGVQVSASSNAATSAQVDYIQITVTYSLGDTVHKMAMMGLGG
jgi:hypothetical protein